MSLTVNSPLHLWASRRAAELLREGSDLQIAAARHWANHLAGGAYRPGAPYTERWEGGVFCLHLRPKAGLALLYTEACDAAAAFARMDEAPFRRLLAYCEKVNFDPAAPDEGPSESHPSK